MKATYIAGAVLAADQVTKLAAHQFGSTSAVEPVTNPDYALGLVSGAPAMLAAGTALVIVAALAWRRHTFSWWIVPLLVGGAASNLFDRVLFGAVRDFLPTPWIVFNLADVAIAAAVVGFYRDLHTHHSAKEVNP
jgi:lipoprotein signal peptidase